MSNRLIRLAQRVRVLSIDGESRAIWPSEKAVLVALADDARDADGGVARLAIAEIALRTGINRRTVEVALRHLAEAGLIERDGRPGRATARTTMHIEPAATSGVDSDHIRCGFGSDPNPHRIRPESDSGVESTSKPVNHWTRASARENLVEGEEKEAAGLALVAVPAPDPVDAVFAAWDAWRDRARLPGQVTRNAARRVAVARVIADIGLGRTLMMIDAVERGVQGGKFRRKGAAAGQDDIFATFDAVFEVGHAAGLNLLARLLDGEFGALDPPAPALRFAAAARGEARAETEDIRRLRARLRDGLGDHLADAWIDPLDLEFSNGVLRATAPSGFHADWITGHYLGALRGAAAKVFGDAEVRVLVKERANG